MLKNGDESICKPLGILFRSCLHNGKPIWFLSSKKQTKKQQQVKNYRPISWLPVSSKIFEGLLYDSMFKFFTENSLISQNQSGFKTGNSCTNQLLSVMHQIYKSFGDSHEVRSVFLVMSKAFDKVWRNSLIFKLKRKDI